MKSSSFRKTTLEEIAIVTMGQSPKGETLNHDKKGTPFMQGNRTFGYLYPRFDTYTTSPKKMARAGDVIMSVRAPVGEINIARSGFCIGRGLCSLRSKTGDNRFLYYLLMGNRRLLAAGGNGTVFTSINSKELNSFEVVVPDSLEDQRKIANILRFIDDKIIINSQINDYLAA